LTGLHLGWARTQGVPDRSLGGGRCRRRDGSGQLLSAAAPGKRPGRKMTFFSFTTS
jgi:hypothetical protein